jgi:hypothetical protein
VNQPARALLASTVFLTTLFVGYGRYHYTPEPPTSLVNAAVLDPDWKSTKAHTRAKPSRLPQVTAPYGLTNASRLDPIPQNVETRLIIPSSTCPPRRGEPEAYCQ